MTATVTFQGMAHGLVEGFPSVPDDWESASGTFSSASDGAKLFYLIHSCPSRVSSGSGPLRVLIVLHGQGEHCGRYQHFPFFLQNSVDVVATMDHRGHGRSEGVRGHVERFQCYVQDAQKFVCEVKGRYSGLGRPVVFHLLGHSMGGLIALLLLQEHGDLEFQSATLSAPLLGLKFPVPLLKRVVGHAMSRVLGSLQLETGLDTNLVSHDSRVVQAYAEDSLVHSKATTRFFTELLGAMVRARSRNSLAVPTLFLVPLADEIVESQATLEYAASLKQAHHRVVTYE
ncbi:MAG: lysophospholipase, partial [Pseudomonadota bacterium]